MRKVAVTGCAAAVVALVVSSSAAAQGGRGWGVGSPYNRMYDPKTVETVHGKVTALDTVVFMQGMTGGVHAAVQAGNTPVDVHLGPAWFLGTVTPQLRVGDEISVTGSRVTMRGKVVILAAEVARGRDTLKLRERDGRPVWAGLNRP